MDHACGLWGGGPDRDRPGPHLLLPRREVALKTERAVGRPREHRERRLREARPGEHLCAIGFVELRDLCLELSADCHHLCPNHPRLPADGLHERAGTGNIGLVNVRDVEDRLG